MAGKTKHERKRGRGTARSILGIAVDEHIAFCLGAYDESGITSMSGVQAYPLQHKDEVAEIQAALVHYCESIAAGERDGIDALSISAFGLTDSAQKHSTAFIRPGWSNPREIIWGTDMLPDWCQPKRIFLHNDATCAALGEYLSSHGDLHAALEERQQAFAYLRVGAGVNIGLVINGEPWQGALHPEFGHVRPKRMEVHDRSGRRWRDEFEGVCPTHRDCFEGLICKAALEARAEHRRRDGDAYPDDDAIVAHYVAQMCTLVTLTLAPVRIVLGGSALAGRKKRYNLVTAAFAGNPDQRPYPVYRAMSPAAEFIVLGRGGPDANLVGALEWGRSQLVAERRDAQ